jgi:hypothetical protein
MPESEKTYLSVSAALEELLPQRDRTSGEEPVVLRTESRGCVRQVAVSRVTHVPPWPGRRGRFFLTREASWTLSRRGCGFAWQNG